MRCPRSPLGMGPKGSDAAWKGRVGGGGTGRENCIPGARSATGVGAGKGGILAKTSTERAQERGAAWIWKQGPRSEAAACLL